MSKRLLVTFHMGGGCGPVDVKVIEDGNRYVVVDPEAPGKLPEYDYFHDALDRAARRAGWRRRGEE